MRERRSRGRGHSLIGTREVQRQRAEECNLGVVAAALKELSKLDQSRTGEPLAVRPTVLDASVLLHQVEHELDSVILVTAAVRSDCAQKTRDRPSGEKTGFTTPFPVSVPGMGRASLSSLRLSLEWSLICWL